MNRISEEEQQQLDDWIAQSEQNKRQFDDLVNPGTFKARLGLCHEISLFMEEDRQRLLEQLFTGETAATKSSFTWWKRAAAAIAFVGSSLNWRKMATAAIVAGLVIVTIYFLVINEQKLFNNGEKGQTVAGRDIGPGKYKATLLLADSSVIVLDSAKTGKLAQQGSTTIQNRDTQLLYMANAVAGNEVLNNTLVTDTGETYAVKLSDGTIVRLNNASSITYPVAFTGAERRVSITGEAFFEVAKDPGRPFIVQVSPRPGETEGPEIEVTGTQFNVMAYSDEPAVATTLVEGEITIRKGDKTIRVKPGEQALLTAQQLTLNPNPNVAAAIDWKNQSFNFKGTDMKAVMRQLARWYNVQVTYGKPLRDRSFSGMISRNKNLSEVLKILEEYDVNLQVNGRVINVTEK